MRLSVALAVASLGLLLAASPIACSTVAAGQAGPGKSRPSGNKDAGEDEDAEGAPELQLIGRWDKTNASKPKAGWPGSRLIARFSGTGAKAVVSSVAGVDGNESWFNVIVDGTLAEPVKVDGASQKLTLASGLRAGNHTVELEKRTEPKWGTITIESVTFEGGELLPPPARAERRIEYLAESTIDGFGVEGNVKSTCQGEAPAKFDNARKSVAFYTATTLSAEPHLIAYSAKGVVANDDGTRTYLPELYRRALPDDAASKWNFASWTPDVVVLSIGGTDMGGGSRPPNGFQAAYDALVMAIRGVYANAHIFMTVWSQIKQGDSRPGLQSVLEKIKAAHLSDAKLHVFLFEEADYPVDETGCYEHANDAHHKETATELAAAIKAATNW